MIQIQGLLQRAKEAALQAGKVIMEVYATDDFGVDMKSDNSPLTRADKAAHKVITAALDKSGLPVLSEEGSNIPYEVRKDWDWFWLVDPLDGTKEFIKRNGEFTVNIALMHNNVPVAGVIYAPCLDVLYVGSQGAGAYKIVDQLQVQLPFIEKKETLHELQKKEKITIVASKSHLNDETKIFIEQFKSPNLSSMGSSLKLMLLAEGVADIYPRIAPTMEWDTAAGHGILRSLNRSIYQTDLQTELLYNKEDLLNPSFVAF
ncbi:3'(2'),5'-bisphosphate nucleotidase CysQ [Segetibacter aerophilus]|uniref:3'(2'),5'-bisphosphate nucleotidase CysQ n=1 Tax=Segetibacter aerophilus TaxID=670293 RepID=A0A512BDU0_9BACT|nr:3'(2'),5'-bisphosphate nucleotidase CysQ [Segetibacter aerophilus]GEO10094.1 3'(2'),5'-bisphosphate nucleotidase CysQ [Segetibacter aerophilus]